VSVTRHYQTHIPMLEVPQSRWLLAAHSGYFSVCPA